MNPRKQWRYLHVFPSFEAGGAQLRIAEIINRMDPSLKHSVVALDGRVGASYRIRPELDVELIRPGPKKNPASSVLALRRLIGKARPDLLLTYNWGAIDAVLAAVLRGSCPVVHNECGFSEDVNQTKRRRILARRLLLNRVHKTVVVSETMRRIALEQFRIQADRVQFIQTGVDTVKFHPHRDAELRAQLGASPETLLFGYVGGMRPEKNVSMLVRAFCRAAISGSRLVLFGDGGRRGELEALVSEMKAADVVVFAGHVENVAACYGVMDVFLMSSLTEQTPNALLEAMASGLPVVCTDVGDSSRLLGSHQSSFCTRIDDLESYVESLRTLASDSATRQQMGSLNRKRCEDLFGIDRMVEEYARLYEAARRSRN